MRLHRVALVRVTAFLALLNLTDAAQTKYSSVPTSQGRPLALSLIREVDGSCVVSSLAETQDHRLLLNYNDVVTERAVFKTSPHSDLSEQLQLIGHAYVNLWATAEKLCPGLTNRVGQAKSFQRTSYHREHVFSATGLKPKLEIYPLVVSGPSRNRVDLTFFSDGYTIEEKDKFLADAKRLAVDMSQNQTFATVQPLMNFWAAFSPSRESGIGVAGMPKDTTFGLYRDGTELRAVYCSKRDAAREACLSLHSQCDYPILLGNDPLYGGLGGEFTISTASKLNGALVLRHELGHSIIGVGEEYDGGFAYFGVNAVQNVSPSSTFKWSHWLSSPPPPGAVPREERAIMPFQVYPWTLLNKTSPWSAVFSSSGLYSRYLVRFSLSGLPLAEDLKVQLDGEDLGWKPRSDINLDRWHYDIYRTEALTGGEHELRFTLGDSARAGTAQLCSAEIIEYGDETEFNSTVGCYGAFPTFSDQNMTTFRPTNEQCLMRIVTSPSFCSVCLEGLWLSLLQRVSLIDEFSVTVPDTSEPVILDLDLVPLGQLRASSTRSLTEIYLIVWERDGVSLPHFANLTRIMVDGDAQGIWRAFVRLHTDEVKADPNGLLESRAEVHIFQGMDGTRPIVRF